MNIEKKKETTSSKCCILKVNDVNDDDAGLMLGLRQ